MEFSMILLVISITLWIVGCLLQFPLIHFIVIKDELPFWKIFTPIILLHLVSHLIWNDYRDDKVYTFFLYLIRITLITALSFLILFIVLR